MVSPLDRAYAFVDEVASLKSSQEVLDSLQAVCSEFGLERIFISGIPLPGESIAPYVMLNGWPEPWSTRYIERGYVHVDPCARRLTSSATPFAWSEVPFDRQQPEGRVMEEATEFGLMDGLCVPIYGVSGYQAGVSFGTRKLELDAAARSTLQLIGIYGHNRVREILGGNGNSAAKRAACLSPRELECLQWCSLGKTNWEISEILGLSERTVEHYLASATRKLDSVTRTQAVAEALRAGVIY